MCQLHICVNIYIYNIYTYIFFSFMGTCDRKEDSEERSKALPWLLLIPNMISAITWFLFVCLFSLMAHVGPGKDWKA